MSKGNVRKQSAPPWLEAAVYERKRQRTVALVKEAVDALVKQREQDGTTRVSLTTIGSMSRRLDPEGRGVAHTAILENEEAYAYYKRFRTASKPKKRQPVLRKAHMRPLPKGERDQGRVRQRYRKLNKEELVDQLLSVEQQYAELHERYLVMNDQLLEWQLRTERVEAQLNIQQEQQ